MADINNTMSILKMENFYFSHFEFSRNDTYEKGIENDNPEIGLGKDTKYIDNTLTVSIFFQAEIKEFFNLNLIAVGKFKCEASDISADKFEKNAISIMFPYIRSEITLLTSQPNFNSIILPPINVNALFDKFQEETNRQEETK